MKKLTRRSFVGAGLSTMALASGLRAQENELLDTEFEAEIDPNAPVTAPRNISSWRKQVWQDHFDDLGIASIVADTTSRTLHYWNSDGSDYRVFPTSVPMSEELTRRGYTKVVRKRVGPDWTPTANMMERDPTLKYMPPGPNNPLGTHAMYLTWPAYLIHGTHDTRKIGRRSSSGCIGLYNEFIAELYEITPIGTQVRII